MTRNQRLLFILPCLLFVLSMVFTEKRGPYFFGAHYDPEYAYLLNSLTVLNIESPTHTDHPGTTVQEFGAVVILARWLWRTAFLGAEPLHYSVLGNPEDYLRWMNLCLNVLYCGLLILVSLALYRRTESMAPPLVFQVTYLGFTQLFLAQTRVTPEPMLVIAALLYLWALLPALDTESGAGAESPRTAMLAGAAYGFGCVTKVLFFPLGALFLVLPGVRQKLRFAGTAVVSAVVLMLPIYWQFQRVLKWLWSLLIHDGYYGQGKVGTPSFKEYVGGGLRLWAEEPGVYLFAVALGVVFLLVLFHPPRSLGPRINTLRMFLLGCLAAFAMLIALNAKHYHPRYLVAAMAIAPMAAAIVTAWLLRASSDWKPRRAVLVCGGIFIALVLYKNFGVAHKWLRDMEFHRNGTIEIRQVVERQGDCLRACVYRGSQEICALHFGNGFSANEHKAVLKDLHPNGLKYHVGENNFRDFSATERNDLVRERVESGGCVLAMGLAGELKKIEGYHREELASNPWETLVRLRLETAGE